MKKYRVTGWVQSTIVVDVIVDAENEEMAHSLVCDDSRRDVNKCDLQYEEMKE